jgi:hypothetical protein
MHLSDFIDERIQNMLKRPLMWGGNFCVETGILTLLEIKTRASIQYTQDGLQYIDISPTRIVQDAYTSFLRKEVPEVGCSALAPALDQLGRKDDFADIMRKFVETFDAAIPHST